MFGLLLSLLGLGLRSERLCGLLQEVGGLVEAGIGELDLRLGSVDSGRVGCLGGLVALIRCQPGERSTRCCCRCLTCRDDRGDLGKKCLGRSSVDTLCLGGCDLGGQLSDGCRLFGAPSPLLVARERDVNNR